MGEPSVIEGRNPRTHLSGRKGPLRRVYSRAELEDLRIHHLRYSVATWLAEEGNAAQFIQQALGLQSLQATMKYIHAARTGSRAALERLSGLGGVKNRPEQVHSDAKSVSRGVDGPGWGALK